MESVLLGAAVLACPVGMGAMMWFMARGMKNKKDESSEPSVDTLRERTEDAPGPLKSAQS